MKTTKKTLGVAPTVLDSRDTLTEPEIAPSGYIRNTRAVDRRCQINAGVSVTFRNHFNEVTQIDGLGLKAWELIMASVTAFERLSKAERFKIVEEIRRNNPPAFRTYKDK